MKLHTVVAWGLFLLLTAVVPSTGFAQGKTELTWFGHAAFRIKTPTGKVLFVDPWIANPANPTGKQDLAKIAQADLILVSHGHFDHVGDSAEIAKRTGAKLVSTFDLGNALVAYRGFPAKQAGMDTLGNFGGELSLLDGEVQVAFIPAVHSSDVAYAHGKTETPQTAGNPGGFLITVKNGPTIYHTGDTDVFGDMALVPHFRKVDVMLACIGGHFTMGPERAAEAVKQVGAPKVVPMHYGTFPLLKGTPEALSQALLKRKIPAQVQVMKIGQPQVL